MIPMEETIYEGQMLKWNDQDQTVIVIFRSEPGDMRITGVMFTAEGGYLEHFHRDTLRYPTFKEGKIAEIQGILAVPYALNGYTKADRAHLINVELPKIMALPDDYTPPESPIG